MYVVRWKPGVQLRPTPVLAHIVGALDRAVSVCRTHLEVTCGCEGHPVDDPHTRGEALDVGVRDLPPFLIVQVKTYLENILGPLFTVLFETPAVPHEPHLDPIAYVNPAATGPHLHIQPKKGTLWPPLSTAPPLTAPVV